MQQGMLKCWGVRDRAWVEEEETETLNPQPSSEWNLTGHDWNTSQEVPGMPQILAFKLSD